MASMLSNVLGYLCPKGQENALVGGATTTTNATGGNGGGSPTPGGSYRRGVAVPDRENDDCALVYGIEDVQDDWQIVRKMSDVTNEQEDCLDDGSGEALFALEEDEPSGMDDVENRRPGARACPNSWYLAPPPCFTRSAPSPSTNPLENLLIEHPSMSVYLLPVAAASSSSSRATLYRSAPPLIMEENLNGRRSPSPAPTASAETTAEPPSHRITHAKRKRRVRAQRHAQVATMAAAQPTTTPTTTPRELGVRTVTEEQDKQNQNEEKDSWTGKKLLAKNQLQRANLLPEVAGPKKRANREGNYRCLH